MEIMVQKRKEKKLTQTELGQRVGCSQRAIAGYELDERKPSVPTAQRIGRELGFPWTAFFEEGEPGEDDAEPEAGEVRAE